MIESNVSNGDHEPQRYADRFGCLRAGALAREDRTDLYYSPQEVKLEARAHDSRFNARL
jgi:hypothetical protein